MYLKLLKCIKNIENEKNSILGILKYETNCTINYIEEGMQIEMC